jgi:hypothetical protein
MDFLSFPLQLWKSIIPGKIFEPRISSGGFAATLEPAGSGM